MNIARYVARAATLYGGRIAILDGARTVTFRQLEATTNRLAHALMGLGVQRRDRVAIVLPNSLEWIESDWAIAKAGAMTVPVGVRLHAAEVASIVAASEPRLIVTDAQNLPRLAAVIDDPGIPWVVVGSKPGLAPGTIHRYAELMALGAPDPVCVEVDRDMDGRVMRFTSGTTGKPKGVYLTHRNWEAISLSQLLDRWSLRAEDTLLGCSPYPHAAGLWLLPALVRGAAVRVFDRFDPARLLAHIEAGEATVVQMVPTMLRRFLDTAGIADRDLRRLQAIHYGGAPIDNSTLQEALSLLGPKLVQGYGLNEAGIVCTLGAADHLKVAIRTNWYQPLGREVAMAEVRIVDVGDRALPAGEVGELAVRGDMVLLEYWRNPEATAAVLRGGFFHTGDLALRGDDGYLYLAGRSKDIVVTGGFNVYPEEVEAVLGRHPSVHQCAVVGVPHREWGEQVTAFVVLKPGAGASEASLIDFCREQLTSYKKPRKIRFVAELPVNSNGKVVRRILRERLAQLYAPSPAGAGD